MMTTLQHAQLSILVSALGRVLVNRFLWRASEYDDLRIGLNIDFLYTAWLHARHCNVRCAEPYAVAVRENVGGRPKRVTWEQTTTNRPK